MQKIKKSFIVSVLVTIFIVGFVSVVVAETALAPVVLTGKAGGVANGGEWRSKNLKDRVNLILYTTPSKQKEVQPLLKKLESTNYSKTDVGIIFIVNLNVPSMLKGMAIKKLNKKAKSDTTKTFIVDKNKLLVKNWGLKDGEVNILIIDKNNNQVFSHFGSLSDEIIVEIFEKIDELI